MLSQTDCDRIAYLSCEPVAYPLYTSDYVDELCKRWCDVLGTVAARVNRCLQRRMHRLLRILACPY